MTENNNTSPPLESPQLETSHAVELNSMTTSTYFFQEALTSGISIEQLRLYIKYPMRYNMQLRQLSREAYNSSGMYANCIDYMTSIPTLDFIATSDEDSAEGDLKCINFRKILRKINHKLTTRDILMSCFIDGMYVAIFRNTKPNNKNVQTQQGLVDSLPYLEGLSLDDNIQIQPLDLDYCKFIGVQNNQQLVAFNLMYFNQFKHGGLLHEIKNFPPEFIKAYLNYQKDASKQWMILDPKTTIALKFKANVKEPYGRCLGLSALFDIRFAEDYYNSQINTVNDLASSIYMLMLPTGEKAGACSLNKDQQQALVTAFEGAVSSNTANTYGKSKVSKITLAPGAKIERMTKDASLLKDTLSDENTKKISTALGFASASLNAQGEGGASYSTLAVNVNLVLTQIFALVENIACEYTRILNISDSNNKPVNINYLRTSIINQNESYTRAKDLYTLAGGTNTHMIAEAGYDVDDYIAIKKMEKRNNYKDLFEPNATSFTMSGDNGEDNPNGRPPDNTSKNENTVTSKALGGNKNPKPSTKK